MFCNFLRSGDVPYNKNVTAAKRSCESMVISRYAQSMDSSKILVSPVALNYRLTPSGILASNLRRSWSQAARSISGMACRFQVINQFGEYLARPYLVAVKLI